MTHTTTQDVDYTPGELDRTAPAQKKCHECFGRGRKCLTGCSAHPDNWYECEKCGGTGRRVSAHAESDIENALSNLRFVVLRLDGITRRDCLSALDGLAAAITAAMRNEHE